MILKEIRSNAGLTQEGMAKKINVSQKSISAWELGKGKPKISTAIKIGKIFCIDWTKIYQESEEEK